MTEREKQAITGQIRDAVAAIARNSERGDLEASQAPYLNAPDFIAINSDGTIWDFEAFRKADAESFATMESQRITTLEDAVGFSAGTSSSMPGACGST